MLASKQHAQRSPISKPLFLALGRDVTTARRFDELARELRAARCPPEPDVIYVDTNILIYVLRGYQSS